MLNYFNVLCSALVSGESEVKEGKGDLVGEGQGEESQGVRGRPDTEEGLEEWHDGGGTASRAASL